MAEKKGQRTRKLFFAAYFPGLSFLAVRLVPAVRLRQHRAGIFTARFEWSPGAFR